MYLAELLKEVVCIVTNWFPDVLNIGPMLCDRVKDKTSLGMPLKP